MSDPKRAKRATEVMQQLLRLNKNRLQHGSSLRQQMLDDLKAGKMPTGYRYGWIRDSAQLLISLLEDIAQDFNNTHEDDRASLDDLIDIVTVALKLLQKKAR